MQTTSTFLDPATFRPDAIDGRTRAFVDELLAQDLSNVPALYELDPETIRASAQRMPAYRSPIATERRIPTPAGDLPARIFVPEHVEGVHLFLHQGGFVLGSADGQDAQLEALAQGSRAVVVSVDYRLAPEHPYPAAHDDGEAAALWLIENARAEFGAERLTIGGASTGALLAVATLTRMRDKHSFTGFERAALSFGVFDCTLTPSVVHARERGLPMSPGAEHMNWWMDHYLGDHDRRDPEVSPLYADLSDLPEALFLTGTLDPLVDDTLFMHAKWVSFGNAAQLAVYPGGVHMFTQATEKLGQLPEDLASRANARTYQFLSAAMRPAPRGHGS